MSNILIGICCGGTVHAETITSLVAAMDVLKEKGTGVMLSIQIGGYTAHNRNKLVQTAQEQNASHIMFIDADQTFPASGIQRLLDHDKDIVGGLYNTRGSYDDNGQLISTVKVAGPDGEPTSSNKVPSQLFKCFAVATGFMLIKMSVFEKIPKPYFVAWETAEGDHRTEDVEFCRVAGKQGFDIWCSPSIPIGHIGQKIY